MAFPTNTTVLENFNAVDAHPMTGWTDLYEGVDSNGTTGQGSAASAISYRNTLHSDPVEFYLTVTTKPGNGSFLGLHVFTADTVGYTVQIVCASGTDSVALYRIDGPGDSTQLGSTISQEFSNGDGLGLEVTDGTNGIKAYRRSSGTWSQLGTTQNDTNHTGSKRPCIEFGDTTARVDDLCGGTVVAASSTPIYHIMNQ